MCPCTLYFVVGVNPNPNPYPNPNQPVPSCTSSTCCFCNDVDGNSLMPVYIRITSLYIYSACYRAVSEFRHLLCTLLTVSGAPVLCQTSQHTGNFCACAHLSSPAPYETKSSRHLGSALLRMRAHHIVHAFLAFSPPPGLCQTAAHPTNLCACAYLSTPGPHLQQVVMSSCMSTSLLRMRVSTHSTQSRRQV